MVDQDLIRFTGNIPVGYTMLITQVDTLEDQYPLIELLIQEITKNVKFPASALLCMLFYRYRLFLFV